MGTHPGAVTAWRAAMGGRLGQGPEEGGICLIHVVVEQKPIKHFKATILQLKINKNKNKKELLVFFRSPSELLGQNVTAYSCSSLKTFFDL